MKSRRDKVKTFCCLGFGRYDDSFMYTKATSRKKAMMKISDACGEYKADKGSEVSIRQTEKEIEGDSVYFIPFGETEMDETN